MVVAVTALITVRGLWQAYDGTGWQHTIRSDARGYYAYLTAIFIDHDLGHEEFAWEYVNETPDGTLNKYFCGTAVMMAPWFGLGHLLCAAPNGSCDGFSEAEFKAIAVGAWVYLLLGLLALRSMLTGMGVRDGVIVWLVIGLGLGTTLLQYAGLQPGWSHVYSFCAVSFFLWVIHKLVRGASPWFAVAAAATLGLIVLIRPVNALVILAIPVIAGAETWTLIQRLIKRPAVLFTSLVVFSSVVGIQLLLWHLQTGHWFEWGYKGEGFHWGQPEVIKVLFGFRRGLFLWTPFFLLAALSAVLVWKQDRVRALSSALYWTVTTFVISSWWIWYYGSGFGSRVFIDHYPVLVVPMALVLNSWSRTWWVAARAFMLACIVLHLAQMWQYYHDILHRESMDRAKYAYTFLRFSDAYRGQLGGNYQTAPFNPNGMEVIITESCDLDAPCRFWSGGALQEWEYAYAGPNVCVFAPGIEFGTTFRATTDMLPIGRWLYLEVGLQRLVASPEGSRNTLGITEVVHKNDTARFYQPFRMDPLPPEPGVWEQLEYRIPVPPLIEGDELRFYFWNKDNNSAFLVDAVFIRVSAVNPY